jgi:hypothetical protein
MRDVLALRRSPVAELVSPGTAASYHVFGYIPVELRA